MGTKTEELQKGIKNTIKRLGWSQKRLAREVYYHTNDIEDELEVRRAEESIKKLLTRKSTPCEKLEEIASTIPQLATYKKVEQVTPFYESNNLLSFSTKKELETLSQNLTNKIEEEIA